MSYPDPIYFGEAGENSATLRRDDHDHTLTYRSGGTVDYLATGASTAGLFGLYRRNFGEGVSGPDPHFHKTITESFYVLSGTVMIYDGTDWVDTEAGDFVHVPAGGVHGFRNESGKRASMLLHFSPGAPREEYFETLKKLGEGLTMTDEERDAFYLAHDNYWL